MISFVLMLQWTDFFGRVKDKAGDVERILKEKDKHGNSYKVMIALNHVFMICVLHIALLFIFLCHIKFFAITNTDKQMDFYKVFATRSWNETQFSTVDL